jgi:tetratricopeptide (TPR) repeat protein
MKKWKITIALFVVVLTVFILTSCASSPSRKYREQALYGMIYDGDNRPVHNAAVYINGGHIVSSDIQGHFAIPDIKPKLQYTVTARKEGYEELQLDISFPDPSYILYLHMVSAAQLLNMAGEAMLKKDWQAAESCLTRAQNAGSDPGETGFLQGLLLFNRNRYREALSVLIPITETHKTAPYLFLLIADIYQFHLEDPGAARFYLNKFLELRYDPEVARRIEDTIQKTTEDTIVETTEDET